VPRCLLAWVALVALGSAQAETAPGAISGQVRWQWEGVQANTQGPLAAAHALYPGAVALPTNISKTQAELRASAYGLTAVATLQQTHAGNTAADTAANTQAWVNELYSSHDAGAWQFSAGKKIVAWDVGYGFRPNDMVQQEERRALVDSTAQGRPLLLAEHFNADTAWSLVWVNPTAAVDATLGQEPALAARLYQRSGASDWYGFARVGARTGGSVGLAQAWVVNDALELHSSVRVSPQNTSAGGTQWLLGGTWTTEQQLSLLAETWQDNSARQVFLRLNWQHDAWKPALDVLYTPADQGRAVTTSLTWQGDRVQVQGGWRVYAGPAAAALAQLPSRQVAYLALTWAF
jgi:hypothetical protein